MQVRLVRPGSWTTAWTHQLERGELATAVVSVQLRDHDKPDGLLQASLLNGCVRPAAAGDACCVQALVVVGTSQGWGEDYPCQGRLLPLRIEAGGRGGQGFVLSAR